MKETAEGEMQVDKDDQKRFYDEKYESGHMPFLANLIDRSLDDYARTVTTRSPGKRVLDYGCGNGVSTMILSRDCASAVGIDISEAGITWARENAAKHGITNVSYHAMDAEKMTFEDGSFDMVCGSGILHHLHFKTALQEVTRVLKKDGMGVFQEPLGHNILARLFRALTPNIRPKDEQPLRKQEFALIEQYFGDTEYSFSHFISMTAILLQNIPGLRWIYRLLDRLDQALFRMIPSTRFLALEVIMVLKNPRNPA